MRLVVKGGRVLDPFQKLDGSFDIVVENGKISEILPSGKERYDGAEIVDASGMTAIPGLVDIHTHLREPGHEYKEDIESGTMAAAAGGVTSVACMANTIPVNDNASVTEDIIQKAASKGHVRVYPVGAMTRGLKGKELAEIGGMKKAGIVAVSDDGMPVGCSQMMRLGLEYCRTFDLPVITHAEDPALSGGSMNEGALSTKMGLKGIPNASEDIMVMRDIQLAELTGARLHIAHLSTKGAVNFVREAKQRGVRVTAEAVPHHFTLTEKAVEGFRTDAKMNPPLRTEADVEAIKAGLKDGTIDAIATDHAPHSSIEKNIEFERAANGIIGLETMLALSLRLVDEGILTMEGLIEKMTSRPASIIGIEGGTLAKGKDADITVFNHEKVYVVDREKMRSKSTNTPFHGWKVRGKVAFTIVGGKIVYREEA